jgi:prophage regulatory protein
MPTEKLIRRPKVQDFTGLPTSTLYELMACGEFPQNIPLHGKGRAKAWIESQVQEWIKSRIEEAKKQLQAKAEEEEQEKTSEQQEEEEEAEEVVL